MTNPKRIITPNISVVTASGGHIIQPPKRKPGRQPRNAPPIIETGVWVVCDDCDLAMDDSLMDEHRRSTGHTAYATLNVARIEGWLPLAPTQEEPHG